MSLYSLVTALGSADAIKAEGIAAAAAVLAKL